MVASKKLFLGGLIPSNSPKEYEIGAEGWSSWYLKRIFTFNYELSDKVLNIVACAVQYGKMSFAGLPIAGITLTIKLLRDLVLGYGKTFIDLNFLI